MSMPDLTLGDVTVRVREPDVPVFRVVAPDLGNTVFVLPVPGPPGPPGSAGGTRVTFTQTTPAAQWTIPHTFTGYPSVELIGADGFGFDTDVEFVPGFVIVTHAQPTAGTAILT